MLTWIRKFETSGPCLTSIIPNHALNRGDSRRLLIHEPFFEPSYRKVADYQDKYGDIEQIQQKERFIIIHAYGPD
jgi:hypothetical protein